MFAEARLKDGSLALVWELRPGDRELLREGYEELSPETRFHRFLSAVPHLTDAMLDHLVDEADGVDNIGLVLVALDDEGQGEGVGVAHMIRYPDRPTTADVAVTVRDEWQGCGVATALLAELMRRRPRGVTQVVTTVTADNVASLAMLRRLGPMTETPAGPNRIDIVVDLPELSLVSDGELSLVSDGDLSPTPEYEH